jgi:hypothetical protein
MTVCRPVNDHARDTSSRVEVRLSEICAEDYATLRAFFHDLEEFCDQASDYPEQVSPRFWNLHNMNTLK